ncbi:heme exporter protein A [Altererythrobacter xiamenensis]|uniref:Heme exporter protein A n=1 Tax=Altererythrobacter xiamenensis TaxID=1316679 RepID=A0A1Y6EMS7_9SPHN|nr:heme ABC exporter ATP-binding protein CcmA [Altererythrobacter xiamenensis]SMQ61842.1 heme exporter protein A [Altererythrobacter xiamenensis]
MQARLAASDLACRRGDRVLFRGLSLALGPGDVLHIEGANGIGKTSLLRILAGLLAPYAGSVEREGAIGLVDERPALDPDLPLGKALGFWSRIDGSSEAAAIAERLALTDLLDVPVRYLSTGQRKRAALARLMGQDAPIWLLDEPLSGLDEVSRGLVAELVSEHSAAGGIAVIASHQPLVVERFEAFALAEYVL